MQRGDLRRGARGFAGPAAVFADVDEADRLRPAALLRDVAEQPRFLRARDDEVARWRPRRTRRAPSGTSPCAPSAALRDRALAQARRRRAASCRCTSTASDACSATLMASGGMRGSCVCRCVCRCACRCVCGRIRRHPRRQVERKRDLFRRVVGDGGNRRGGRWWLRACSSRFLPLRELLFRHVLGEALRRSRASAAARRCTARGSAASRRSGAIGSGFE